MSQFLRRIRRVVMRIDPNCTWCGGSGYWVDGNPCIKCNPVQIDPDDE